MPSATEYIFNWFKSRLSLVEVDALCFAGVFLLSLSSCWLLSLAYPQGLVTEETLTYWLLQKNFQWVPPNVMEWYFNPDLVGHNTFGFHWFGENQLDWYRTIPYCALMSCFTNFKNPTNALFWLNGVIFSISCASVFLLGRILFASRQLALALSLALLFFEIVSMRSFYANLQVCADPFYAQLIFLAVLLACVASIKHRYGLFLFAYALFGLAAFTKPVGVALWFIWLPYAIWWLSLQAETLVKKGFLIAVCFMLTVGPLAIWCLRNYCVYSYAKSSGVGGSSFLQAVLPFITKDEKLFDDPYVNSKFYFTVKTCEIICSHFTLPDEKEHVALGRMARYERYYLYGPASTNPFQFLVSLTNPEWHGTGFHFVTEFQPRQMFPADDEAGRVAVQIIKDHPLEYVNRFFVEYIDMFRPLAVWYNPLSVYQSEPFSAYNFWDTKRQGPRPSYLLLYPGKGFPDGAGANVFVAKLFGAAYENPIMRNFLMTYYVSELWLSHLIFLVAVYFFWQAQRQSAKYVDSERVLNFSLVVIMLFLTTFANAVAIASCKIAQYRFQIAGELELHLILLLAIFLGLNLIANMVSKRGSQRSLS